MRPVIGWALVLLLGMAPRAFAQLSTGNIYGTVMDESGAVLPGVSVTLSGAFGTRSTTTGELGAYRFLRVDHGTHMLTVRLEGLATLTRRVTVTVGADIDLDFTMKVASVEETVTVTAETPVVDAKKLGTDVSVQTDELTRIPSGRDPWALMNTIPGIVVFRVNLAGNTSGQQTYFVGKGASWKDTTWTIDGMVVTDEASWSSPTYWNYDSFDEVNFVTGGQDVTVAAGGIAINVVTKRGTNAFHGGGSVFYTSDDLYQASNLPDELVGDPRLQGNDKANHTEQITDWSANLGGPILRDRLWFWGVYGRNDIRVMPLVQTPDRTVLKNMSAKLNWQAGSHDMISLTWFYGVKEKYGRRSGTLQQSESHLYDQGGLKRDGWLEGLSKIEWDHVFGPNFALNAKYAYYNSGFQLTPQGGLGQRNYQDFVTRQAWGSNSEQDYLRPQWTGNLDGHYFVGHHEIRFGTGYRRTGSDFYRIEPGDGLRVQFYASGDQVQLYRDANVARRVNHWSAYIGDTFARGRLTLNVALRWDRAVAFSLPTTARANVARPDLLPDLEYPGSDGNVVEWNNIVPRIGVTYALDEERKTVVRASFSRYAGMLGSGTAGHGNPVNTAYLRFPWNDLNEDRDAQLNEVSFDSLLRASNVDPANPAEIGATVNKYDPDYGANTDNEIIFGIEHELMPNLAVSAAYTFRESTNITSQQIRSSWYPWLDDAGDVLGASDFHADPQTLAGRTFTTYQANDDVWGRITWGLNMMNRPGYTRIFNGFELGVVKRLSNRWMGRVAFSYNRHRDGVEPEAIVDPTRTAGDPLDDGGPVSDLDATWQLNVNGLYELPWGFEISGNLFGRQGLGMLAWDYATLSHGVYGQDWVLPDGYEVGTDRYPNLWNLDLRVANRIPIRDRASLVLSAELFNVLNSNTVTWEVRDLASDVYGRIDEILGPRILRLAARLSF